LTGINHWLFTQINLKLTKKNRNIRAASLYKKK